MSYIEDMYHYEDWEVDNGDGDVSIISIVNDFYECPRFTLVKAAQCACNYLCDK